MKASSRLALTIAITLTGTASISFATPSVSNYQSTSSAYEDIYVNGKFNANSGNQDQASYDLNLAIDYDKVLSTPDKNISLNFTGNHAIKRDGNEGAEATSNYQVLGSATMDKYFKPNSKAGFIYGKGELGLKKGQENSFSKITVGLGYGRVVNVTPMARAIRLVEAMREIGTLKRSLSHSAYQNIANIIAKESAYRSQYGVNSYKQAWIGEIAKVMGISDGKSIIKAYDVLTNEKISTRKNGWLARAGIGSVLTDYDAETGKPAIEVGLEFHRPLTNSTQFSNESILTATLKDNNDGYNINNKMTLTHEVSDKIDWENTWLLAYSKSDNKNALTSNTASSSFNYHLNNKMDLGITATLSDDGIKKDIDASLNMGLKYRLK